MRILALGFIPHPFNTVVLWLAGFSTIMAAALMASWLLRLKARDVRTVCADGKRVITFRRVLTALLPLAVACGLAWLVSARLGQRYDQGSQQATARAAALFASLDALLRENDQSYLDQSGGTTGDASPAFIQYARHAQELAEAANALADRLDAMDPRQRIDTIRRAEGQVTEPKTWPMVELIRRDTRGVRTAMAEPAKWGASTTALPLERWDARFVMVFDNESYEHMRKLERMTKELNDARVSTVALIEAATRLETMGVVNYSKALRVRAALPRSMRVGISEHPLLMLASDGVRLDAIQKGLPIRAGAEARDKDSRTQLLEAPDIKELTDCLDEYEQDIKRGTIEPWCRGLMEVTRRLALDDLSDTRRGFEARLTAFRDKTDIDDETKTVRNELLNKWKKPSAMQFRTGFKDLHKDLERWLQEKSFAGNQELLEALNRWHRCAALAECYVHALKAFHAQRFGSVARKVGVNTFVIEAQLTQTVSELERQVWAMPAPWENRPLGFTPVDLAKEEARQLAMNWLGIQKLADFPYNCKVDGKPLKSEVRDSIDKRLDEVANDKTTLTKLLESPEWAAGVAVKDGARTLAIFLRDHLWKTLYEPSRKLWEEEKWGDLQTALRAPAASDPYWAEPKNQSGLLARLRIIGFSDLTAASESHLRSPSEMSHASLRHPTKASLAALEQRVASLAKDLDAFDHTKIRVYNTHFSQIAAQVNLLIEGAGGPSRGLPLLLEEDLIPDFSIAGEPSDVIDIEAVRKKLRLDDAEVVSLMADLMQRGIKYRNVPGHLNNPVQLKPRETGGTE